MEAAVRQANAAIDEPDALRVASKFARALKGEKSVKPEAAGVSAYVGGTTFAFVSELSQSDRRKLNRRKTELAERIRAMLTEWVAGHPDSRTGAARPGRIEGRKGRGLGEILREEEGLRRLDEIAIAKRLEDWAGPVAGAMELSRELGLPRSTLNRWQHAGDVIGLLKGIRKHVYPIEQFVDGRPARGLADVKAIIGNPRVAWHWLRGRNPALRGCRPIDLLKDDRVREVVEAAQSYFQQ
ncbi:MAG: DUF2384 domain-containing protein [Hyphomicrobiales bacterium]|nr:DUF2384 domain-containing protein [Hyphomicrobiales bacterium]